MKPKKMTPAQIDDAVIRTADKLGTDVTKQTGEAIDGLGYYLAENPQAFDCRRCGTPYQPEKRQWIFYEICDNCFKPFNKQKMDGRVALLVEGKKTAYFEDVDAWMKAFPYKQ